MDTPLPSRGWEWVVCAAVAAVPLSLLVLWHSAWLPWVDEAQFVDPAASLFFGQGFTSMGWPYQSSTEFFAGNAPGFTILLAPWFELWGFGLTQARSLNWLLAAASALILWALIGRLDKTVPVWLKALIVGAAFSGGGVMLSYWSARYDMLGLLVACLIALSLSFRPSRLRLLSLVLCGALLFYAGFHLVVAATVLFGLLAFLSAPTYRRPALALGCGTLLGLGSWLAILGPQGLAQKFFLISFGSQHTLTGQVAQLVMQGDTGLFKKVNALLGLPLLDLSMSLLALFLLVLFVALPLSPSRRPADEGEVRLLALLLVLVVPAALLLAGKFPVYYVWISHVSASVIAGLMAWRCKRVGMRAPLVAFVMVVLCAGGLGVHNRLTGLQPIVDKHAYDQFDGWVRGSLQRQDIVFSGFESYFAVRSTASRVILPTYGQTSLVKGIPERDTVTALLVPRSQAERAKALVGGSWSTTGETLSLFGGAPPARLDYVLLRRTDGR